MRPDCYFCHIKTIENLIVKFEGLMNENHPNTFFMLIAKCKPIGDLLGVEKNDMVITNIIQDKNVL